MVRAQYNKELVTKATIKRVFDNFHMVLRVFQLLFDVFNEFLR